MFARTRVLAIGLAAASALAMTAIPAARADSDIVTITAVGNPSPGVISISVTSATALTELDVMLTSTAHPNALSFTMADFTLQSGGTGTDGTYTLTDPVTDTQLPSFDSYMIDVTAADSGGGSAANDASFLGWFIQPALTLNATQTTFDYDNESITFSGALSLVNPDGTAVDPADLAGQPLLLTDNFDARYPVTTGAGGNYSVTVGLGQAQNDSGYTVTLAPTSTTLGTTSPLVFITAVSDPAKVTAKVSATQVNRGTTVTVTGTAEYNPGTGFVPLQNSAVVAYAGAYDGSSPPLATAHTNLSGQYTISVPMLFPTPLDVYAGGVPGDFFMDQVLSAAVSVTPKVNVALPVKIASLSGSLNRSGTLALKGCLTVVGGSPSPLPLQVQYSVSGGRWKLLRTVHGLSGTTCGGAPWYGERFSYKVPVAVSSASYRLAYPGSKNYSRRSATSSTRPSRDGITSPARRAGRRARHCAGRIRSTPGVSG